MTYNTEDEVRLETGNILDTEYTDPSVLTKLQSAFSRVQLVLKKPLSEPYLITDVEYGLAKEAEVKFATAYCLKAYGPEFLEKVKELEAEATADLEIIKENTDEPTDTGDVTILVAVTPYLSIGAAQDENPNQTTVFPYRGGLTDPV
jgi:hypothetical protein